MRRASDQRREREVECRRGSLVELRQPVAAGTGSVAAPVPRQPGPAAGTGVLQDQFVVEAGGDERVSPRHVMRSPLGDAGRTDRDGAQAFEPAVEQAPPRTGNGSEGQKDPGREAQALLHRGERLHQRPATPPADEAEEARAVVMAVHVGEAVEEVEQAFVRLRLDGRGFRSSLPDRVPRGAGA